MKKIMLASVITAVFLLGCAAARPKVTHSEAIKTAAAESNALVQKFCVLKDVSGGEEKLKSIQDGLQWAVECEQMIDAATEEEKLKIEQFRQAANDWMKEIKAGDKDRLIRWTADNIPNIFGLNTAGEKPKNPKGQP